MQKLKTASEGGGIGSKAEGLAVKRKAKGGKAEGEKQKAARLQGEKRKTMAKAQGYVKVYQNVPK